MNFNMEMNHIRLSSLYHNHLHRKFLFQNIATDLKTFFHPPQKILQEEFAGIANISYFCLYVLCLFVLVSSVIQFLFLSL